MSSRTSSSDSRAAPRSAGVRFGRVLAAVGGAILAVALAVPAYAHDPLFVTEEQGTPETGPLLPDGTISFAVYGEIDGSGESRGLQVRFEDGDPLFLGLLVPDAAPENLLADSDLPVATVTAPDGSETVIGPPISGSFFEPFTSTNYLRLGSISDVAVGGTYDIEITGKAPARFTFSVGNQERFGTPVERLEERLGSFDDLSGALGNWLATKPQSPAAAIDPGPGSEQDATTTTTTSEPPEVVVTAPASAEPAPQIESPAEPDGAVTSVPWVNDERLVGMPPAIMAGLGILLAAGLWLALTRKTRRR